jgi:hypothetical protein
VEGGTQSAGQQEKERSGIVIDYLVDTYELNCEVTGDKNLSIFLKTN